VNGLQNVLLCTQHTGRAPAAQARTDKELFPSQPCIEAANRLRQLLPVLLLLPLELRLCQLLLLLLLLLQ